MPILLPTSPAGPSAASGQAPAPQTADSENVAAEFRAALATALGDARPRRARVARDTAIAGSAGGAANATGDAPALDPAEGRPVTPHAVRAPDTTEQPAFAPVDLGTFLGTPHPDTATDEPTKSRDQAEGQIASPDAALATPTVSGLMVAVAPLPTSPALTGPGSAALQVTLDPRTMPSVPALLESVVAPAGVPRESRDLVPAFRDRLERVVDRMQREFGYTIEVVETVRSQERQDALFSQGRTQPGPVVTWTRASNHTRGLAADVTVNGGWTDRRGFERLARVAREEGLRTLWPLDPGHVELVGPGGTQDRVAHTGPAQLPGGQGAPTPITSPALAEEIATSGPLPARADRATAVPPPGAGRGIPSLPQFAEGGPATLPLPATGRGANARPLVPGEPGATILPFTPDERGASILPFAPTEQRATILPFTPDERRATILPFTPNERGATILPVPPDEGGATTLPFTPVERGAVTLPYLPGEGGTADLPNMPGARGMASTRDGSVGARGSLASAAPQERRATLAEPGEGRGLAPVGVARVATVAQVAEVAHVARVAVVGESGMAPTPDAAPREVVRSRRTAEAPTLASVLSTPLSGTRVDGPVTRDTSRDAGSREREPRGRPATPQGSTTDVLRDAEAVLMRATMGGEAGAMERTGDSIPVAGIDRSDAAERIARVLRVQESAAERPVSSVLLRLDHPEGGEDRVRVDLRGTAVGATIDVRDRAAAEHLRAHAAELQSQLGRHGLEAEAIAVRTIARAPDATLGVAGAANAEREALRASGGTATGSGTTQQGQRDPRAPWRDEPESRRQDQPTPRQKRDQRGSR